MCFSPTADLVAGALVLPLGAVALRTVREAREVPFASLPVLFGLHQLTEVLVWDRGGGLVSPGVSQVAAVLYAVFALPVLPLLVPLAVLLLEPPRRRARVLPFVALGALVSAYLAWTVASNGVRVEQEAHALLYRVGLEHATLVAVGYVAAVTGVAVVSGYRSVVAFGVANLVGLSVVALVYQQAFASLWCIWAAVSSVLVVVHLHRRRVHRLERPTVVGRPVG